MGQDTFDLQAEFEKLQAANPRLARSLVELCARAAHETNRVLCFALDDTSQLPWHAAPDWQADSVRAGVLAVLTDDVTPAESHERWMALKEQEGWVYGSEKSIERKEHPCMVPYEELSFAQRQKDTIFGAVVRAVATHWFESPRSLRATSTDSELCPRETDVGWDDWLSVPAIAVGG